MTRPLKLRIVLAVAVGTALLLLVPLVVIVWRLSSIKPVEQDVTRLKSPSGALEAIVKKVNYGALSPYEYRVIINESHTPITRGITPVFAAEKVGSIELRWAEEHVLQVRVDKARIKRFTNQFYSSKVHNVEIQLVPLSPYLLDQQDREGGGYGNLKVP